MVRNMFGGGPAPWPQDSLWNGWWGDNRPFHTPVLAWVRRVPAADGLT
jgi:hypothetical protein